MSRGRAGSSAAVVVFPLVCLFFVGFGLHTMWGSIVTLPHRYDRLDAGGVLVPATIDECKRGLGGGRGVACRLSLTYHESDRTWVYPENSRQFYGLPIGSDVPMLVDPRHPSIAYTVTDVRARTNAGFGVVAGFGLALALVGVAGLGFFVWLVLLRRRRRRYELEW